jgi:hypothetical protein
VRRLLRWIAILFVPLFLYCTWRWFGSSTLSDGSLSDYGFILPTEKSPLIIIPHGMAALLCALVTMGSVGATFAMENLCDQKAAKRLAARCCTRCGYSLTGNLSGICSECGERWMSDNRIVK